MFVLYSKPACTYCERAKALLERKQLPYSIRMIDIHYTKEELLAKFPNAKQFPQITHGENYVGGYEDLIKYIERLKNDAPN